MIRVGRRVVGLRRRVERPVFAPVERAANFRFLTLLPTILNPFLSVFLHTHTHSFSLSLSL